jgi:hypothetical protein
MQKAIIHTTTRVIKRLTTEDSPSIAADESIISLSQPIDLAGGFWKLDAQNNKVPATEAEVDAADVDETKVAAKRTAARQALQSAINDIADNGATLAKVRTYFQALKSLK